MPKQGERRVDLVTRHGEGHLRAAGHGLPLRDDQHRGLRRHPEEARGEQPRYPGAAVRLLQARHLRDRDPHHRLDRRRDRTGGRGVRFLLQHDDGPDPGRTAGGIPDDEKARVYFEYWFDYTTVAASAGYNEKTELAGGKNPPFAVGTAEYPPVVDPPEAIIVADPPEVVVKLAGQGLAVGGYAGHAPEALDAIRSRSLSGPGGRRSPR